MGGWGMGDNARGYRAGARASLLFAASMDAAPWKHVVHAPLNAVVCKKKSAFLMTFHAKLLSCTCLWAKPLMPDCSHFYFY